MQDDDIDVDDKDEGTHRIENDPERGGAKNAPGSTGPRQGRRGEAAPGREQPGGGRRSESEKPDSPNGRWGGGQGPAKR